MTDRSTREQQFLRELLDAGHLRDLGRPGVWGRSAALESVVDGVSAAVRRQFAAADPVEVAFGPLETLEVFERTGYVESFPQLVGSVHVFEGADADHRALLADRERGAGWDDHLRPGALMMVSAACHPLLGSLAGTVADGTRHTVSGWCFRHEPSTDPFRTVSFRQREIVLTGTREAVVAERDLWVERSEALLRSLGLAPRVEAASDPFFGRAGRLMARGQRQNALKVELTLDTYGDDVERTAVASGNAHGTHFTEAFDIRLADGSRAYSACMGFGLERVALALLRVHGLDVGAWPGSVHRVLGLAEDRSPALV